MWLFKRTKTPVSYKIHIKNDKLLCNDMVFSNIIRITLCIVYSK